MEPTNDIITELVAETNSSEYFKKLYEKLVKLVGGSFLNQDIDDLSDVEIYDVLRFSDILSHSQNAEDRNNSYRIISLMNEVKSNNEVVKVFTNAILSKLGNFPTLKVIKEIELPFDRAVEKQIKKDIQKVPFTKDKYFTDSQFDIFSEFTESNCFSFSGPTSMGKSFLFKTKIKEIVKHQKDRTIIVLVPTRALITQFALELKKDLEESEIEREDYIIRTNSKTFVKKNSQTNHIYILTPERLLSYLGNEEKYPINYIFLDEAHKLACNKDSRSIPFYLAIQVTTELYKDVQLYFASPNVNNPEIFLKLYNKDQSSVSKTIESPVSQALFFIDIPNKKTEIIDQKLGKITVKTSSYTNKDDALQIVNTLSRQRSSIIYCSTVNRTIEYARNFSKIHQNDVAQTERQKREIRKLINQIKQHVHEDYFLIDCLEKGVAFHFGNLPQLIRERIEYLFQEEIITFLFCTSTLLEGVNLPAKNIFILDSRKGKAPMEPIDFWNLAGRAGRLTKELNGNIICIREEIKDWDNIKLLEKTEINLTITALTKIDRNLKKIEKLINENNISGTEAEKEILEYLANIIRIDTLELASNYKSPVIAKLIEKNKEKLIELVRKRNEGLSIPLSNLKIDRLTSLTQQDKVYRFIAKNKNDLDKILLPSKVDYDSCVKTLKFMAEMYDWVKREFSGLKRESSYSYYAFLVNAWVNGMPLKQIIASTINFKQENKSIVKTYKNKKPIDEPFDINNKVHVNIVINDLIQDIEQILRYRLEKYFNNYYIQLKSIIGAEKAGVSWANYLEYGTRDNNVISLQNMGLSRQTALFIIKHHSRFVNEIDGEIIVNKKELIANLDKDSAEWEEINRML